MRTTTRGCYFRRLVVVASAVPLVLAHGCLSGAVDLPDGGVAPRKGDAPALGAEDPLGDEDGGSGVRPPAEAGGSGASSRSVAGRSKPVAPARLPLPATRTFYGVKTFLDEYRDAYRAVAPFGEYRTYARTLTDASDTDGPEFDPLRARIAEDHARSHWAFVTGAHELLDFLANRSRDMLRIDKEKNVLARLRTLSFLAQELDGASGGTRYRDWTRDLYADVSERHFGRKVRRRGVAEPGEKGGSEPAPPTAGAAETEFELD